jgi:hypothetical protein
VHPGNRLGLLSRGGRLNLDRLALCVIVVRDMGVPDPLGDNWPDFFAFWTSKHDVNEVTLADPKI